MGNLQDMGSFWSIAISVMGGKADTGKAFHFCFGEVAVELLVASQ